MKDFLREWVQVETEQWTTTSDPILLSLVISHVRQSTRSMMVSFDENDSIPGSRDHSSSPNEPIASPHGGRFNNLDSALEA